jgi:hypothetical protein
MQKHELAVVSIFGRGDWLAFELAKAGVPTLYLDISDQMGPWTPEDWEGPFGFIKFDSSVPGINEKLVNEDPAMEQNNGFALWLNDGPLEMRGPTTEHRLLNLGLNEKSFMADGGSYSKNWPYCFMQNYSCAFDLDHTKINSQFSPFMINKEFFTRHATRKGRQSVLKWLTDNKVTVLSGVKMEDVLLSTKSKIEGLQIFEQESKQVKFNQAIICLTNEELEFVSSKAAAKILNAEINEPTWAWMRGRIGVEASLVREQIPDHTVILQNNLLPIAHQNGMILRRTDSEDMFDLWMKLPSEQRFNREYIEGEYQRACDVLSFCLKGISVVTKDFPQEYNYTYSELGPSRNPIFTGSRLNSYKTNLSNVYQSHPMVWGGLDLNSMIKSQYSLMQNIISAWNKKQEELKKRQAQGNL